MARQPEQEHGPGAEQSSATQSVQYMAELAHAVPGRLRLRLPAAKNDRALLDQVRTAFEARPGIDAVHVGAPGSGSLVIYYDPEQHPDLQSLLRSLGEAGAATRMKVADPSPAPAAKLAPQAGNRAAHRGVRTKLDEELGQIEEEAEFLAEHSTLARSIVDGVKSLDRQIKLSTNNAIDLKILAPVGLAAFTFLEIGALAATPMWVTLVIFSLNHYVDLRAHAGSEPTSADEAGKEY